MQSYTDDVLYYIQLHAGCTHKFRTSSIVSMRSMGSNTMRKYEPKKTRAATFGQRPTTGHRAHTRHDSHKLSRPHKHACPDRVFSDPGNECNERSTTNFYLYHQLNVRRESGGGGRAVPDKYYGTCVAGGAIFTICLCSTKRKRLAMDCNLI